MTFCSTRMIFTSSAFGPSSSWPSGTPIISLWISPGCDPQGDMATNPNNTARDDGHAKPVRQMPNAWSAPSSWREVCQRANGRRKYHSIRRLHARLRRRQVARHLRHEGLGHGVRARLARTLGVSKATITSDVRAILAMPVENFCRQRHQGVRRASETRRRGQPPRAQEEAMSQRCTVRLPDALYEFL
jgi:hypothetical protein